MIGIASLVALVVLAIAGYLVLPAATVVLTPSPVPVGPVDFVVRADPDATTVDAAGGVVPATRLSKDFTASGEFPATGKRVVTAKAKGTLRWTNCDPTRARNIPAGSVARTTSGIGFATDETVFLPVATLTGPVSNPISPASPATRRPPRSRPAPRATCRRGAVRVVPGTLNSVVVKVTNAAAMTGGSARGVHPGLGQGRGGGGGQPDQGPDRPVRRLGGRARRAAGRIDRLRRPPRSSIRRSRASTRRRLVNVEEPTFQLAATATGTVVAVDATLVQQVATERISGSSRPSTGSCRVR